MIPEVHKSYKGSMAKTESSSNKVINDIVMILETDRIIIKTFNALVVSFIHQNRDHISDYLQPEDEGGLESELDKRDGNSQWSK